ncbi:HelD family protein [Halobacillus andaensis]|uniref:HelD family protein n=1 Tax=Halobacillus andaensis TaxID=1176239 RepID=UPI003D70B021
MIKWASSYKGSLEFKRVMDRYVKDIEKELKAEEDFKVEGFTLYKAKNVNRLFYNEYHYLPLDKRLKKIKGVLQETFKKKKKEMIQLIERKFEDKFDQLYYSTTNTEQKRKKVIHLNEQKDRKIAAIKKTTTKVITNYMKSFQLQKTHQYYQKLMTDEQLLTFYTKTDLTKEERRFLASSSRDHFNKNKFELEDLAPLLYLQHLIYGISDEWKVKNVVIDEAQDYSLFQLYALREASGTNLFTILGDLSQGIHSYRGLKSWDQLLENVFPRALYRTLQKSYRTTIEIMELANSLLNYTLPYLDSAEPVVRHGNLPAFHHSQTEKEAAPTLAAAIDEIQKEGMKTIAVITKTKEDAKRVMKVSRQLKNGSFQLLEEDETLEDGKIAVVPTHLSKGLEFDAVIVMSINDSYLLSELDTKLLYVAMTRPLHRLHFIGASPAVFLLDHLPQNKYQVYQ